MPTRAKTRKTEAQVQKSLELLTRQISDVESLWKQKDSDFYEERKFYERSIYRREYVELDGHFSEYGQGIQSLAPMLEDDVFTNVQILNLDEPRLDCIPKETTTDAKSDVEDVRIWLAGDMAKQNHGKTLGRGINYDQWTKGVACVEGRWNYPEEPGDEIYEGIDEDDADAMLKAREEFFRNVDEDTFTAKLVNMHEMSWWPLENPKLFLRQFQIPYTEARKIENKLTGGNLRLSDHKKVVFLGESRNEDNGDEQEDAAYLDVVIRNHYDEQKEEWICTEWIKEASCEWTEGAQYDEYVVPFGHAMYFIVPSGNLNPAASNPHLRYRAPVYSEVVLVQERNYLNTLMLALGRMQVTDNFFYLDASKLSPEARQAMQADGFVFEGAGETSRMLLKRQFAESDQIAAMPGEVKAWPFPEIKAFQQRLAQIEFELERVRPNRFQVGQAIHAAAEATATGLLDQKQASAIPYESHIDYEEAFWEEWARAKCAAILYWSRGKEVTKPLYYRTNGNEPVMGDSKDAGEELYIDADKLKRKFDIVVRKRNQTQAEKMQEDLAAYQDRGQGTITEEQLIKRLGFDDPQKQLAELQREKYRKMAENELAPAEAMMVKVYASALWGTNLAELPLPTGATPAGGNPAKGPEPNEPAGAQLPLAGQVGPAVTPSPVPMPGGLGMANPSNGL